MRERTVCVSAHRCCWCAQNIHLYFCLDGAQVRLDLPAPAIQRVNIRRAHGLGIGQPAVPFGPGLQLFQMNRGPLPPIAQPSLALRGALRDQVTHGAPL